MNKLPDIIPFCNLATKLTFQAQINNAKKTTEINSITFYFQMLLPMKILFENESETFDDVFDRFEEVILGKVYGGVVLEKYKVEDGVKCYLIYDGRNYKIGKSANPDKRLKEIKTANYKAELVCSSEYVPEKFLHEVFAHRSAGGEWFNLLDSDVEVIIKMMKISRKQSAEALMRMCFRQLRRNKPTRSEMRVTNVIKQKRKELKSYDTAKLTFGKYSGVLVKDMMSPDQRRYLYWAYHNVGNINPTLKLAIKMQLGL